jgi:DNA primase large subunit
LKCAGWSYDKIEERIKEWNKMNPEPLKEQIVNGQIKYHKRNKDRILPPNCSNKSYYSSMQLCMPDSFCKKIKNPVNYAILRARNSNNK